MNVLFFLRYSTNEFYWSITSGDGRDNWNTPDRWHKSLVNNLLILWLWAVFLQKKKNDSMPKILVQILKNPSKKWKNLVCYIFDRFELKFWFILSVGPFSSHPQISLFKKKINEIKIMVWYIVALIWNIDLLF